MGGADAARWSHSMSRKITIEIDAPDFDDPSELREAVLSAFVTAELKNFGIDRERDHVSDRAIRERVDEIVTSTVRERIDAAVSAVVDSAFIPTNRYGERRGEPITLREMIADTAVKWFSEKVNQHGMFDAYGHNGSVERGVWLARQAAETVFKDSLASHIALIKSQIDANIKARVQDEIATTVLRLLSPKT